MTAAALICATCGAELRENNKFCHQCGARIPLSPEPAEYKQVTVLFVIEDAHWIDAVSESMRPQRFIGRHPK